MTEELSEQLKAVEEKWQERWRKDGLFEARYIIHQVAGHVDAEVEDSVLSIRGDTSPRRPRA